MINKFLLYILTILLFTSLPLIAQDENTGSISGIVRDRNSNDPLSAVSITLFNELDSSMTKGTETGMNGKFLLEGIPSGRYKLEANMIGYNPAVVRNISVTESKLHAVLDPILLREGITETEEIIVEGEKSPVEFKPDRKVFNVEQGMITQGGSSLDVLKNIPSVSVDVEGNVSLRGSTNVKILVDGKPFGLNSPNRTNLLEQIPASQILSVEVISNPSAKFEAEGTSGIINIVLKKTSDFGYNGSLSLNTGTKDKYNGSFNLNLRNEKLNLSGSYDYRLFNFFVDGNSQRTNFRSTSQAFIDQVVDGNFRNTTHFGKSSIDYYFNDDHSLGIAVNYNDRLRRRKERTDTREYNSNKDLSNFYFLNVNEDGNGYGLDASMNYYGKFKNPQQTLTADLNFSRFKDDITMNSLREYVTLSSQTMQNQFDKGVNDDLNFQMDYSHPFGDLKLETGAKSIFRKFDKDYRTEDFNYSQSQFILNPNLTNHFIYKEYIQAMYAIFSGKNNGLSYQAGLRAEQTNTNGDLRTTAQKFDNNYFSLFPSASLSYKVGETEELQLSYSRRINRPGFWALNPFVNASDPLNLYSGNPNLKPEYINSTELSFMKFFSSTSLTPSVYYRQSTDQIGRTRYLLDSVTTLTTMVNNSSAKTYGGELIFNSKFFEFINLNGSLSYFRTEIEHTDQNMQEISNANNTWSGRASAFMRLPGILDLQLSYFYSGKITFSHGYLDPFQSFDVLLRKDLFDNKATISLRVADVFNTLRFKVKMIDNGFTENFERKRDTRSAFLTLTYKFGTPDKKDDRKRKRSTNDQTRPPENDGFGF
jgi:outer membrane receptor protein involved in Fe transport